MTAAATAEPDDEIVVKVSDYLDGTLPADERADVEAKLANDADWQRVRGELDEQRKMISALRKQKAPATFTEDVTSTINKRSAGAFFGGRRTLGDRVPFGALLVIALVALAAIAWLLRGGGDSGSSKHDEGDGTTISPRP
jgi:anti-sigma factor RsiW